MQASHSRDICWWHPAGHEMADQEWNNADQRCLGVGFGGTAVSPEMMLLLNPTEVECEFHLPSLTTDSGWDVVLDTAHPVGVLSGFKLPPGPVKVGPYQTLALLRVP